MNSKKIVFPVKTGIQYFFVYVLRHGKSNKEELPFRRRRICLPGSPFPRLPAGLLGGPAYWEGRYFGGQF